MKRRAHHIILLLTAIAMLSVTQSSFATETQMKETLVALIQQLQTIKPLINRAEQQQPEDRRILIHFDAFTDHNGVRHAGLRQDIEAIQQALIAYINHESIEPRVFNPINGDFVGDSHV